jgi:hypothetical protein
MTNSNTNIRKVKNNNFFKYNDDKSNKKIKNMNRIIKKYNW